MNKTAGFAQPNVLRLYPSHINLPFDDSALRVGRITTHRSDDIAGNNTYLDNASLAKNQENNLYDLSFGIFIYRWARYLFHIEPAEMNDVSWIPNYLPLEKHAKGDDIRDGDDYDDLILITYL